MPCCHSPGFKFRPCALQAFEDLDPARTAEVRGETRQAVVDDMRVRVVEPGSTLRPSEVDDPRARALELITSAPPHRNDLAARDRQVAVGLEPGPPQGADPAAGQDQVRIYSAVRLVG